MLRQVGLYIRCIAVVGDMAGRCSGCNGVIEHDQETIVRYNRYRVSFAFHYNCFHSERGNRFCARYAQFVLDDLDKLPEEDKKLFVGSVPDKKRDKDTDKGNDGDGPVKRIRIGM